MSKNNKQKKKNNSNSPGFLLKKARESQNLSQDYIAGQLRLAIEIIDALETDSFDRLPAPIFVRGYLRSYTTILGISGGRVIECYDLLVGDNVQQASLATVRMKSKPAGGVTFRARKYLPLAAIGLLVLLGIILWLSSSDNTGKVSPVDTDKPVQKQGEVMPEKPDGVTLPADTKPIQEKQTENTPVSEKVVLNPDTPVNKPVQTPTPVSTDAPAAGTDKPAVKQKEDTLVFSFSNSSWVDVRDSRGKRMIYRMVKPGSSYTVAGHPPFKITLGNAHGVVLKRNNKMVDLAPYIRGNVARFSLGHAGN